MKPTAKVKATGIWGLGVMVLMGITAQVPGFPIDWAAQTSGVPLGSLMVLLASGLGGWLTKEKR